MAPLPSSLSPHICILLSPDLSELLESSSLPPLPHILQSFSPLPQVTTRTTSLASVPHTSFALRFSDLSEIEHACQEDEEQRAVRTIDWISARINKRCVKWIQDLEKVGEKDALRTPWWDELRRCAEGDHIPSRTEGWNHPIAVILAVSTAAPNPLQAITALHARPLQFPSWVDSNVMRYTLIIHPQHSSLSDEEAAALFNAVKKQFGLHSYLLNLRLPTPPPPPVPVPALLPRLPSPPMPESSTMNGSDGLSNTPNRPGTPTSPNVLNTVRMEEGDIQQTSRFTREFVVMSLIPWMEKCVLDWNENFSSTRRLPSRLFSSTRRLFGSPASSPAPTHNSSSSVSSLPGRPMQTTGGNVSGPSPPSQQRRLAEFATILGDLKLAVSVWEALRKEGKGGSDILPLLLTPSPALQLHASAALMNINPLASDILPHAQLRLLLCAVRWEAGISSRDFLSSVMEGDRWLVWAAGNAEEAPSALLLAQAALLSSRRHARRRAALWYVSAANRLEKCGIKPLTMYFLRRAQDLYKVRPPKSLSPSFWESEGKSPQDTEGFDGITSGIEHPLGKSFKILSLMILNMAYAGRLLYTTGDIEEAVHLFLSLLRGSSRILFSQTEEGAGGDGETGIQSNDKVFLDDFRVALGHFQATEPEKASVSNLKLPFKFCLQHQTRVRFSDDNIDAQSDEWSVREQTWKTFWKSRGGTETFAKSVKASTGELFWVDMALRNPLDTEVNLANVTLVVQESNATDSSAETFVEVEVIQDVVLAAYESRIIPISLTATHAGVITITHVKYDFLSLFHSTELLAARGHRLHDTAAQRQKPTYAPDVLMKVEINEAKHKLQAQFIDVRSSIIVEGEDKRMKLWLSNAGSLYVQEAWIVAGPEVELWVGTEDWESRSSSTNSVLSSSNSLVPPEPFRLPVTNDVGTPGLNSGESTEVPLVLHDDRIGEQQLRLLVVYRENNTAPFYCARLSLGYEVHPLLSISLTAEPSQLMEYPYTLELGLVNLSSAAVELKQIVTLSPLWKCTAAQNDWSVVIHTLHSISGLQSSRTVFFASRWFEGSGYTETVDFVSEKLSSILHGKEITQTYPPPINLYCSSITQDSSVSKSVTAPTTHYFLHNGRRKFVSATTARIQPYIPAASYPLIFPLYTPASLDATIFWDIPSQQRSGHTNIFGLTLGAGHAALDSIIENAESAKVKRSMYAETRRENMEVLEAIRGSEWNKEMDPIVVSSHQPDETLHDFSTGSCQVPVSFTLRNYSVTRTVQFTMKLKGGSSSVRNRNSISPPYSGRLTFRGSIPPSESIAIESKLWITRPGTYTLGEWLLETEVEDDSRIASVPPKRRRYLQESRPTDNASIIVCDPRIS
ncbi:ER-golgi trafficking TRAPP I complex 85 kDa subunit-domain-containing protein [Crucibulum laeve]|uniref:ER-golgi trafficking TRAPP I complex 85 kDa subunit-domain-containing protein n=1 Tax=Crucibulum laeve TaxID=68775 RepID=A0A5C3LYA1_9AGAR|nr:ER-golgi trafficking TRAPP I complex 85 kDa subunit-domain-containing protein [Crucibulum laeve]